MSLRLTQSLAQWVGYTKTAQHCATNPIILATRHNPTFGYKKKLLHTVISPCKYIKTSAGLIAMHGGCSPFIHKVASIYHKLHFIKNNYQYVKGQRLPLEGKYWLPRWRIIYIPLKNNVLLKSNLNIFIF